MSTTDVHSYFVSPRISAASPAGARVIMAIRLIVLNRQRQHDPMPQLTMRLGSAAAATQAVRLAETVGEVWPDRFCLSPPCCQRLSPDEALLATLAGAVVAHDAATFHSAGRDFLNDAALAHLFTAIGALDAATLRSG